MVEYSIRRARIHTGTKLEIKQKQIILIQPVNDPDVIDVYYINKEVETNE